MFVTCNTYTIFSYIEGLDDNVISCAFFAAVEAPQYDIVKWALFLHILSYFYSQDQRLKLTADNVASSPYLILSVGTSQ
jgi:hypothetical protein